MKKFLGILALLILVVSVFVLAPSRAGASKNVFDKGTQDELEKAKQISLDILRDSAAERPIGIVDEFIVEKVEIDDLNMAHTRVQQIVSNVPVWEGEAIVHLTADGELSAITDDLKEGISVSTQPNFSAKETVEIAERMYKDSEFLTEEPTVDLWIYRGKNRDHLAYRVQMRREDGSADTAMPVIFVDAQTGEKVFEYDNLQTASGASLYSGTVNITTDIVGSTYYMEDTTRKMGTFNFNNGTTSAARYTDTNDVWDSTAQKAGVDAHYGAAVTYDYYKNVHGRNGIDGNSGPGSVTSADGTTSLVSSRVHYSTNYNNAYWNGTAMTYGDGDGTTFTPLVTLDICGHEMTHGVTERTANLTYSNESGALNESMSDVFGAMVELRARGGTITADTWKIGEQAYTPSTAGDALRYMDNPHAKSGGGYTADDDPDHYSERYTGTSDNGGVHINSGIGNKSFYLAAVGGTHHLSGVTVTGIGTTDAAKIWYRGLTVYMTSGTNFSGARTAMLNAATDLFGASSTQYKTIATTWCAVGVGACPTSGTPTPTPTPTPGGGSELLSNGGFEGSASPWVGSGTGYFYTANGNYPHGGTGYIYFGVNNSVSGQSYQQVTIPSTATGTFTFWLNVTSSETTTSTQYDKLFVEVRNTSGSLLSTLATYSNLNKGTAGSYSQKSFSLSAYKGQTVRVQFRSTTDSSVTTTFRVDDASLK
ncbi:MAG: M4 family metallopeptidase [Acidobacteria bacterium]|nr:M4 family metallopeptidase [Acidobacteriota bacterium]